jgi:hypothetical protein
MSNRTLFEFNHDHAIRIELSPNRFVELLTAYLSQGSVATAKELEPYGVRWFGVMHHTMEIESITVRPAK